MSELLGAILELIIALAIGAILGVITYRLAKRKQLPRPAVWGFLAGAVYAPMITVLSAPAREARGSLKPWWLIARIVLTTLGIGALLRVDDGMLVSRWLGSVYASTFPLFGDNATVHVEGNLIEFSFVSVDLVSSWANVVALGALGLVLGAAFWRPTASSFAILAIVGGLLGALYDYLRWVAWFVAASSTTSDVELLAVPTTYTHLFQTMVLLLFVVATSLAAAAPRRA